MTQNNINWAGVCRVYQLLLALIWKLLSFNSSFGEIQPVLLQVNLDPPSSTQPNIIQYNCWNYQQCSTITTKTCNFRVKLIIQPIIWTFTTRGGAGPDFGSIIKCRFNHIIKDKVFMSDTSKLLMMLFIWTFRQITGDAFVKTFKLF